MTDFLGLCLPTSSNCLNLHFVLFSKQLFRFTSIVYFVLPEPQIHYKRVKIHTFIVHIYVNIDQ
jgi:hypothetical protein